MTSLEHAPMVVVAIDLVLTLVIVARCKIWRRRYEREVLWRDQFNSKLQLLIARTEVFNSEEHQ